MGDKRVTRVRRDLERAQSTGKFVRVTRRIKGADTHSGHVLAVGAKWVLLAVTWDFTIDGYCAVRVADVRSVQASGSERLHRRVLELSGEWPLTQPVRRIALDRTRGLIESAHAEATLVHIEVEGWRTGVCYIGVPFGWGKRSVRLKEIKPNGRWRDDVAKWPLKAITQVQFGGRYESGQLLAGDPVPPLT